MSPILVVKGEREVSVELSTQDMKNLFQALEDHAVNRLINPDTREPYHEMDLKKNIELRKAIKENQGK